MLHCDSTVCERANGLCDETTKPNPYLRPSREIRAKTCRQRSAVVGLSAELLERPTKLCASSSAGVGRAVALGSQTGEEFGLFRGEMAEGSEVEAHFHRTWSP